VNYPSKEFDLEECKKIDLETITGICSCDDKCLCDNIIQHAPLAVLITNPRGILVLANKASAILGIDPESAVAKPIESIVPLSNPDKWPEIYEQLASQGRWSGEVTLQNRDRTFGIMAITAQRIPDENNGNFNDLFLARDITESIIQRREVCLNDRNSTRAEMAGEISHELNNYLSIVLGNLELMSMSMDKGKLDTLPGRVKAVQEGMTRIARFVEGLMAIRKPALQIETIDLNQFLDDEIFYYKGLEQFRNIEFTFQRDDYHPRIEWDRSRLQQALYNLIINSYDALMASTCGKRRITIATSYSPDEKLARISVTDNGVGIRDKDYQYLFRQFFSTKGPGHGFGLLSVKAAVKSFGGKVSASPGPDGGACFTIAIPASSKPVNQQR
jgi:PAS domain S-box-containing protein